MSIEDQTKPPQGTSPSPATFSFPTPSFAPKCSTVPRADARRLEAEGLPFVMVRGRKYRPLNEGRELVGRTDSATRPAATA